MLEGSAWAHRENTVSDRKLLRVTYRFSGSSLVASAPPEHMESRSAAIDGNWHPART